MIDWFENWSRVFRPLCLNTVYRWKQGILQLWRKPKRWSSGLPGMAWNIKWTHSACPSWGTTSPAMAAALTLLARERGGPAIHRQLLFYPVMNAAFDTDSHQQFAERFSLRRVEMMWYWDQYTTNAGERDEITVSPLRANIEQLKRFPAALIITAEADILRDEGEAYVDRLKQVGVQVTAVQFQGTIHDFVMLNALANTVAARGAITLSIAWLRDGFSLGTKT